MIIFRKTIKIFITIIFLITALILGSCKQIPKDVKDIPNPVLDTVIADNAIMVGENNDDFPIVAWTPTRWKQFSEQRFKDIKDAGFNMIIGEEECYGGIEMELKALDYAEKYGMKMFINNPLIRQIKVTETDKIKPMMDLYIQKPAFIGLLFADEPNKENILKFAEFNKEVQKIYPDKISYVNLLPDYATISLLGTNTWEDYLDAYLNNFNPKYISYDYYPIMMENDYMAYGFCKSMSIIAKKAHEKKIPLWTHVQVQPASRDARDFTETDLRWETYMNLAFGVKAIEYWGYATGTEHAELKQALTDRKGNKTVMYTAAQKINKEISAMGKLLLTLNFKGVMIHNQTGQVSDYELESYLPIKDFTGGDYLIGCLEDSKGNQKLMVVNLGIKTASTVNITFLKNKVEYYHVWEAGVRKAFWLPEDNTIKMELAPGEGRLIELGAVKGVTSK